MKDVLRFDLQKVSHFFPLTLHSISLNLHLFGNAAKILLFLI